MNYEYEIKHFERNGFKLDEIVHFLAKHGINIDIDGYEGHPEIVPANVAEWKRIMSLEPILSVDHITHAFIGIDPYDQSYWSDDINAEYQRRKDMLLGAVNRGDLNGKGSDSNQIMIDVMDLLTWCEARDIEYPLIKPKPLIVPKAQHSPEPVEAKRWPWGDHTTQLLEALADAAKQLWSTYDPDDPCTAPTNDDVSSYLLARKGVSENIAKAMATILRPESISTGRRPSARK